MWDKMRKGRFELVTLPNVSLKKAKGERRSLKHLSVDSRVEERKWGKRSPACRNIPKGPLSQPQLGLGCLIVTHWTLEESLRRRTPAVGNCLELM